MSGVRPRALVHRGVHAAAGLLLEAPPGREEAARARALALWAPGVRILQVDGGLCLRFPRAAALDAAAAPGHLLVEDGGVLLAAPLSPAERAALAPPPGALVAVRAGLAVALVPGPELDAAAWLGLAPDLVPVEPLGALPPAPVAPAPPPAPELRRALGVPEPSPAAARVLSALRTSPANEARRRPAGAAAAVVRAIGGLLAGLARALRAELELATFRRGRPGALPARARAPSPPGLLRRALVRLAFWTRVARLAGLRQGAYLGRMFRMFERGDLDEALRHAIPLGRDEATGLPTFGAPRPRDALSIVPRVATSGSLLASGPDLYGEMKRLYRRVHEMLARQGRHDEAAFVLAELLRADEEAVSYLERHGKLGLAAELAEARGLPVGLVVRQLFLAGEADRAVALARAGRAWADAVDRLERSGKRKEADALRLAWAEDLATAGDLEAAVGVVRRVEAARALALGWILRAAEEGGPAGDALLATWLELDPARLPEVRARVLDAAADVGQDGPPRRAAVARGLLGAAPSEAARVLARPILRGALRDLASGAGPAIDVGRLTSLAADGALDVDMPPLDRPRAPSGEVALRLDAHDRGTRPVLDAAVLPGGRVLAALGEAGAALLARDGRVIARLDAPAHRLVVSDAGTRALALAPRGEAWRVSALDLAVRTVRLLGDLRLDAFAESFDGAAWVVGSGRELLVLDTMRDDLRAAWHVAGLPGPPGAIHRDLRSIRFATADAGAIEVWRYELPGPILRDRDRGELSAPDDALAGLAACGDHWLAVTAEEAGARILPAWGPPGPGHEVAGARELLSASGGAAFAAAFAADGGVEVVALEPRRLERRAAISLRGATSARVRVDGDRLTACDSLGRIVGVELEARRVTHVVREGA